MLSTSYHHCDFDDDEWMYGKGFKKKDRIGYLLSLDCRTTGFFGKMTDYCCDVFVKKKTYFVNNLGVQQSMVLEKCVENVGYEHDDLDCDLLCFECFHYHLLFKVSKCCLGS